jgi:hypothetical protein
MCCLVVLSVVKIFLWHQEEANEPTSAQLRGHNR